MQWLAKLAPALGLTASGPPELSAYSGRRAGLGLLVMPDKVLRPPCLLIRVEIPLDGRVFRSFQRYPADPGSFERHLEEAFRRGARQRRVWALALGDAPRSEGEPPEVHHELLHLLREVRPPEAAELLLLAAAQLPSPTLVPGILALAERHPALTRSVERALGAIDPELGAAWREGGRSAIRAWRGHLGLAIDDQGGVGALSEAPAPRGALSRIFGRRGG